MKAKVDATSTIKATISPSEKRISLMAHYRWPEDFS